MVEMRQWITELEVANSERKESGEKVVFCRGFIYETRFVNGSDESDRYNIGVVHQPPSGQRKSYGRATTHRPLSFN